MADAELVPADRFDDAALADLFTRGYAGYYVTIKLDAPTFANMATTQNLERTASRIAVLDGKPVGFAMLGIRERRGWIGGMGVAAEGRGHKLGERLMRAAIDSARERALREVSLEVLVQNVQAAPIYERLGFRDTRTLEVLGRKGVFADRAGDRALEELAAADVFASWDALHATEPTPWQRDRPALEHWAGTLKGLGVRESGRIVACVLFVANPARCVIGDVAFERPEHAPLLDECVAAALAEGPEAPWTLLNLPVTHPARAALLARGFAADHTQREMRLVL